MKFLTIQTRHVIISRIRVTMSKRKRVSTTVEEKQTNSDPPTPERSYWLFKSEPDDFGMNHLLEEKQQTACWDGVRNYQARNIMKSMKLGDKGFFYHSNAKKATGIAGTVEVVREAYPDESASKLSSKYYDSKHTAASPVWFMVDVKATEKFDDIISLQSLKEYQKSGELADMMLLKKGSRLSVQPVTKSEWDFIIELSTQTKKKKK